MELRPLSFFRPLLPALVFAAALGAGSPTPVQATEADRRPVAVSPGSATDTLIGDACPTFVWGAVPGARADELVVYRVEDDSEAAKPMLRQRISGGLRAA